MPLPALRLLHHAHGFSIDAQHAHAAHEAALIDPWLAAQGVVARAERGGAVQAQEGPGGGVGEVEGQAEDVACC